MIQGLSSHLGIPASVLVREPKTVLESGNELYWDFANVGAQKKLWVALSCWYSFFVSPNGQGHSQQNCLVWLEDGLGVLFRWGRTGTCHVQTSIFAEARLVLVVRMNVTLEPGILRWARERAGLDETALAQKLATKPDRVMEWEKTGELPLKKAELLAKKTYTPFGYLFLKQPPDEKLPIPDFRTVDNRFPARPSPNLLDTVYQMQRRQAWMREFLIDEGEDSLSLVGSLTLSENPLNAASLIRKTLGCEAAWAANESTWTEALMRLRQKIEETGILIVINGVVGNNTRRKLKPEEFRGFALVDSYAPLIFINGSDFKAAQMFTVAHELAHIWIAKEGVSNFEALQPVPIDVEKWCNAVAAEFLVPEAELRQVWLSARNAREPFQFLASRFKVSSIVAARRALDLGLINRTTFLSFYNAYQEDERRKQGAAKSGGDFWATQRVRVGQRFGAAVVRSAREGRLLYREAYNLTGLSGETFDRFAEKLGFSAR